MNSKGRLITFLLPEEGLSTETGLYYRDKANSCHVENGFLSIPAGTTVSFDTYFNSFDYDAYKRFTALNSVALSLFLRGKFHVRVIWSFRSPAGGEGEHEEILTFKRGKKEVPVRVSNRVLYEGDFFSETKKEMQIGVEE